MAQLRLYRTSYKGSYVLALQEQVKVFVRDSVLALHYMGVVVHPELPPYILHDWVSIVVYNRAIFASKYEYTVE